MRIHRGRWLATLLLVLVASASADEACFPVKFPCGFNCGPWNESCMATLILRLGACDARDEVGAYAPVPDEWTLERCVNLAVSGTGSKHIFRALNPVSQLIQHQHSRTILSEEKRGLAQSGVDCFIATLREPTSRFEAGFRDSTANQRTFPSIDEALSKFPAEARARPWEDFFGRTLRITSGISSSVFNWPTTGYLLGSESLCPSGGAHVHLLCTETLTADLSRLLTRFGRTELIKEDAKTRGFTYHPKSEFELMMVNRSTIRSPALRDWISLVMFPTDTMLHRVFCTGNRDGRDAERVRSIVQNVSRQGAALVARNAEHDIVRWR